MFKRMSLAGKIGVGFALLILIAVALGGFAVWKMHGVKEHATQLALEYVPEVSVANDIERNSLLTMYAMRGWGLSEDQSYYDEGMKKLTEVDKYLADAKALADSAKNLTELKGQVETAEQNVATYRDLVAQTAACFKAMNELRAALDSDAKEYMDNCAAFLKTQNDKFASELAERSEKIKLAQEIVNLGTEVRVANFKGQAENDTEHIQSAIEKLSGLKTLTDALMKLAKEPEEIDRIKIILSAGEGYADALKKFVAEFRKGPMADASVLQSCLAEMDLDAGSYVSACSEFLSGEQTNMATALADRVLKINMVSDIIDAGNDVQQAVWRSQALRDPELIRGTKTDFEKMDKLFADLRAISFDPANLAQIDATAAAGKAYHGAMDSFLAEWLKLQDIAAKRTAAGNKVIETAQATSAAGMASTKDIADNAASALSTASSLMIGGLIVAAILGIALAFIIVLSITRPIANVIRGLMQGAEQVGSAASQVLRPANRWPRAPASRPPASRSPRPRSRKCPR